MTLADLLTLMQTEDMNRCKTVLEAHCIVKTLEESIKEYDPKLHKIADKTQRPDKLIKDEDGRPEATVPVARLPLPIQKKIVLVAASFLGVPELQCTPNGPAEETMLAGIDKTWADNKLDYKFKNIAKKTMAQRHAAELWFTKDALPDYWQGTNVSGKYQLSMKILSHCAGDTLYPVFDEYGDMIAFGRMYQVKNADNKNTQHFDVYTADTIYYSKNEDSAWLFADINRNYTTGFKGIPNIIKKIPVIYYWQPLTEWEDVQPLIERLEVITSNHSDTNDYSGSPIVVASGVITGFAGKGEQGKVLQAENGAKVEYLTYDSAPESIKMEIENLLKYIFSFTHTPDISFENMKGLGVFTGVALKMLFLDAHLKAADKEELFGECLQRRINYLKAALSKIDESLKPALSLSIKPKFNYYLPANFVEEIDNLVKTLNAGIISKETAVKLNPLVSDSESELQAIKDQGPVVPAIPAVK